MVASSAIANPVDVNCNQPEGSAELQDEINDADEGDEIVVEGNCVGVSYVISTDRLTLSGQGSASITGDGINAAITNTGHHVTIEDWAVIDGGAADGILVRAGGSAVVRDIPLITGEDGVVVTEGAFVEVDNSDVDTNDDGIFASLNGTAKISNTDISGILDDGVVVVSGGAVDFAGGNTINDNGGSGLFASGGQVQFSGANTVQNNNQNNLGNHDIFCVGFSRVAVTQSITSTTQDAAAFSCRLFGLGVPIFVP